MISEIGVQVAQVHSSWVVGFALTVLPLLFVLPLIALLAVPTIVLTVAFYLYVHDWKTLQNDFRIAMHEANRRLLAVRKNINVPRCGLLLRMSLGTIGINYLWNRNIGSIQIATQFGFASEGARFSS